MELPRVTFYGSERSMRRIYIVSSITCSYNSSYCNEDGFVHACSVDHCSSVSPLSYFKLSQGEGGIRSPFIIKLPNSETKSSPEIVSAYVNVRDITPTLLESTGVQYPSTFNGKEVHSPMGKSLKPLLEGTVDKAYSDDDAVSQELFNSTSVFMGDWKVLKNIPPVIDGKWHLFNIISDVGENNDLSAQCPEILQKMTQAYNKYANDVGVVVPSEPLIPSDTPIAALAVD